MAPHKVLYVQLAKAVLFLSVVFAVLFTIVQAGILFYLSRQCEQNACKLEVIDWPQWFPFLTQSGFNSLYFTVLFLTRTVLVLAMYGAMLVLPAAIAVMCTLYFAANQVIARHVPRKRQKATSPRKSGE